MNLDYLKETYHLTKTESQILYYLDQQSTNAADLSIREVAKHCFSSPSSIIRLAKKLNLSGYNELIYKLKEAHFSQPIPFETAPSFETTNEFCQLLAKHKSHLFVILGHDFSRHLAAYISEVFNFHGIPSITTAYTHSINSQNNQNFLFIILSHSGEEKYLKETALLAKEKKHPIISFVGAKNSTLGQLADLVFSTDSYSPFSTSVAQPQMFFGQTLITFEALICAYLNHEDSIPISPKNK